MPVIVAYGYRELRGPALLHRGGDMQQVDTNRIAYSVAESATMLGLGRTKMVQLVAEDRIRHIRVGRRVLIPRSALEEFIERQAQQ